MASLFEQFRRNRDERADSPAFLIAAGDRSVPISWRRFTRDIEEIAWIIKHNLAPGTKVALLGENSYEWIVAHAAGIFSGLVVVPLEVGLTAEEIARRLIFVEAEVLLYSALYAEKAGAVGALMPKLMVKGFGSQEAEALMAVARAQLALGEESVFERAPRAEGETAMIVFTSGTTSQSRGVELTLAALSAFTNFAAPRLEPSWGDRSLMLLPLHHIYGIAMTYLMLARGVALGVCPDFRRFLDAVARFRANCLYLVPALAEILAAKIAQRGRSADLVFGFQIKWVLSGGAPLSGRTHEHLESLGMRVLQIYGLTETCAAYAMSPCARPRPGSVGLSAHGASGIETKVSSDGHLLIRGPVVMRRYYREDERTAEVLSSDGWFDTGDIGRIDEDGYVWITGRASRTIVLSSGKKVAPEELEAQILAIPGVREVMVSGDGATRELQAEIYSALPRDTLLRQLDVLNRKQPIYKRIRKLVERAEPFERTASGKIKVGAASALAAAPMPPGFPSARRARAHRRDWWLRVGFGVFTATAVGVVFLNLFHSYVLRAGSALPEWVKFWVGLLEESGQLLLTLLVVPAIFCLHRVFKRLR